MHSTLNTPKSCQRTISSRCYTPPVVQITRFLCAIRFFLSYGIDGSSIRSFLPICQLRLNLSEQGHIAFQVRVLHQSTQFYYAL